MDNVRVDMSAAEPKYAYWQGMLRTFLLDILAPMSVSLATGLLTMPLHLLMPGSRFLMSIEAAVGGLLSIAGLGIGLSQWLWVLPLVKRARKQGRPEFAKGMMSGAWMVFLLNAGCWGIIGGSFLFMSR